MTPDDVRRIVREELEAAILYTPPSITGQLIDELSSGIAKRLNERSVEDVTTAVVAQLRDKLTKAVLAKVSETVDKAYWDNIARSFSYEFVNVLDELHRLRLERERDDWWRHGAENNQDDEI